MPEGDTIARAASTLRQRIGGRTVVAARPAALARLAGLRLERVTAVGKHLYMHFDGGLALHTHMRMTGAWHVYAPGARWRRAPHRATAALTFDGVEAVLFAAPVCEIVAEEAVGGRLGPDVLAPDLDEGAIVARARASRRPTVAELLLDQGVCAGIGNIHRCDALWHQRLDPFSPPGALTDRALVALYRRARDQMRRATVDDAFRGHVSIHRRAGRPCPRCGTPIEARPLGDPARQLFWCPSCQRASAPAPPATQRATPSA